MSLREDGASRDERVGTADISESPTVSERPRPSSLPVAQPTPPAPEPPVKRRSARKLVLATILAAVLGGAGYEGWQYWTVGRFFVSTDDAYVQADISVLAAKVSGYLDAVPVVNGEAVRKGDVIAQLDDGDYRLAVRAAEDKLATQISTIARIARQAEAAEAQVSQSLAQVEASKADAVRAAADYVRSTQMQADFVAKSKLDQTKADRDRTDAAVKGAQAAVVAARANVEVLNAQKQEAESLAGELRTAVDRAKRDLAFTVLRAPFDGVVGNKAVEAGAYVGPGTRVAALVPLQSVRIDANFKETQLAHMKPGQPVTIAIDAYPDRAITGEVESLSPASGTVFSLLPTDNATGNFTKIVQRLPVRVHVPEDIAREGLLRPGLSVTVKVDTRGREPGVRAAKAGQD